MQFWFGLAIMGFESIYHALQTQVYSKCKQKVFEALLQFLGCWDF